MAMSKREQPQSFLNIVHDNQYLYINCLKQKLTGKYMSEWQCPKGNIHNLLKIVHDNQYLYINCVSQKEIYRYTLDGKLVNSLKYFAYAMEIVNNQFYFMDYSKFFLVDIKTNSMIQNWTLPKENNKAGGGWDLKVDQNLFYC